MVWEKLEVGSKTKIRKRIDFSGTPGPTVFAKRRVDSVLTAFSLVVCSSMIKTIMIYTNHEAARQGSDFRVTANDLWAFIGVLFCRGVFCQRSPAKEMWSKNYGLPIVSRLMSREKFLTIMKFIRFDDKRTRPTRVTEDKFCLIRDIWERFIMNSQACYIPGQFLTVDEQLVASKTRCAFTQFMPNKPDKFGIKLWILGEVAER